MPRAWHLSIGVRVNPHTIVWVWTWRELALLRVSNSRDDDAPVLQTSEESAAFRELLIWCEARTAKIGRELLLIVPRRRLARFLRGFKEIPFL